MLPKRVCAAWQGTDFQSLFSDLSLLLCCVYGKRTRVAEYHWFAWVNGWWFVSIWESRKAVYLFHYDRFVVRMQCATPLITAGGVVSIWVFLMAIWALVLQAWGWSCNGQGGGGSSPPPSWVRTDSTVLTHSLQLTTLSLSLSLCFNFFLPFPLDDASLPLCITGMHTNLSVHMYPNRHVGVVSIITLYLTFSSSNTSAHCSISFVRLLKHNLLPPNRADASFFLHPQTSNPIKPKRGWKRLLCTSWQWRACMCISSPALSPIT